MTPWNKGRKWQGKWKTDKRVLLFCKQCGNKFLCHFYRKDTAQFCSMSCRGKSYGKDRMILMQELSKGNYIDGRSKKPGYMRVFTKRRKLRLKGAEGSHTFEEWEKLKATYKFMCLCCKRTDLELTEDHIVPISKGGTNYIWNIQPLCKSCNCRKYIEEIDYRKEFLIS